jgi:hypothetical protein
MPGPPSQTPLPNGDRRVEAISPRSRLLRRSIHWTPTGSGHASVPDEPPIFITQDVLAAVQRHLDTAPDQNLLGFLVGELVPDDADGAGYCLIDSTIRVPLRLEGGDTAEAVSRVWGAVMREVRAGDGELVGWYRTRATGGAVLTPQDVAAHARFFRQPWHVALVVAGAGEVTSAGVFRAARGDDWDSRPEPFHEVLADQGSTRGIGWDGYVRADGGTPFVLPPEAFEEPRPRGRRAIVSAIATVAVAAIALLLYAAGRLSRSYLEANVLPEPVAPAALAPTVVPGGNVRTALQAYHARARLFDDGRMTCADLARGLALVEERFLAYAASREGTRDEALLDDVRVVDGHFEESGCPRP